MTISSSERTGDAGRTDSPDGGTYLVSGMSLRDWFAGQALIAISRLWKGNIGDFDNESADRTALAAYRLADAMLAARAAAKGDGR